jgi:SET domain-containing protein
MPVLIKKSRIEGKGVFANTNFKKGDVVMKWDASMTLTKNEAKFIPARYRKYLVHHKGRFIMSQAPEKYLNHSCEPNTKEGNLYDVALKSIRKGEELTTDYSIEDPLHLKMKCNCKSKNCKKVI